jgi:hypothetical protein
MRATLPGFSDQLLNCYPLTTRAVRVIRCQSGAPENTQSLFLQRVSHLNFELYLSIFSMQLPYGCRRPLADGCAPDP